MNVKSLTSVLLPVFLLLSLVSCGRKGETLVDRAMKQLPVSFPYLIEDMSPGKEVHKLSEVGPVYQNDSICVLQFRVDYKDETGKEQYNIMRYFYLIDIFMSRSEGKPIFCEAIIPDQPLLSGSELESLRKIVENDEVSLYDRYIGAVVPVDIPFDAEDGNTRK